MDKVLNKKNIFVLLLPIMFTYFSMGFVDLVGVATNYMKVDFSLSDTVTNFFTFMVFFWFLIFAVPNGLLMNRIGRKNTVLISLFLSLIAMIIPLVEYNLVFMILSFSLLGISNALMQVSINPLLTNIVGNGKISSYMTFGQFMKACCSLAAPVIASASAVYFKNWKILYLVFLIQGIVSFALLSMQKIEKESNSLKVSTYAQCFSLLKDGLVLMCFFAIVCHVGIDVGTNVTAAKLLQEKAGLSVDESMRAPMVYFLFRTFASFSGAFIIAKWSARKFLTVSLIIMGVGMIFACLVQNEYLLYVCLAMIGFGNANIFPISLAQAMNKRPDKENEISGLMVTGIFGGAIFSVVMGVVADVFHTQIAAILVLLTAVCYLLFYRKKVTI